MRSIPLTSFDYRPTAGAAPQPMQYADLLRAVLVFAPPGIGITTADGLRAVDISAVIRKATDNQRPKVFLEDADWVFLRDKLNGFRWGTAFTDEIAVFARAVLNAPTEDPNAAPPAEPEPLQPPTEAPQ